MEHSPGFLKLVNEARPYVKELSVTENVIRTAPCPVLVVRGDDSATGLPSYKE
jgi:hypothetical protein